jgi:hypothetical protein
MAGWTTVTENTAPIPPSGWAPVQETKKPQPSGFWNELLGVLGDTARSLTGPTVGSPEWIVQSASQAALADQRRKGEGRSPAYRAVAGVGENVLGIPATRMEEAANRGDTAGVLGAAAVPTALTLAGPAMEGVGKVRALRTAGKLSEMASAPKVEVPAESPVTKPAPEPTATAAATEKKGPAFTGGIAERLGIVDPAPESLMTRAVKPLSSNTGWDAALKRAMPDMKAAEQQLGHPISGVEDALSTVSMAKKSLWQQYAEKLEQAKQFAPNAPSITAIDGNEIADAMMKSVDARTKTQNPGLVKQIQEAADTYRRPMQLQEAEDFLQSVNNELHSYYAKNKVGQQVAARDPATGHVVAEGNALRDALYSKLDELTGPGAADLKQRYGSLSNMENDLLRRKNVAARQQPVSLSEQIAMSSGLGDIVRPDKLLNRAQNIAVARWLKEYGSTDAMITRAFQKFGAKEAAPATKPSASVPPLVAAGIQPHQVEAGNQ